MVSPLVFANLAVYTESQTCSSEGMRLTWALSVLSGFSLPYVGTATSMRRGADLGRRHRLIWVLIRAPEFAGLAAFEAGPVPEEEVFDVLRTDLESQPGVALELARAPVCFSSIEVN